MSNLKKYSTVIIVVLICLLVTAVGGLAGWLLVLHSNGQTISFESAMRGLGLNTPSAGQNGSNYDNIGGGAPNGNLSTGSANNGPGGSNAAGINGGDASNIYGSGSVDVGVGADGSESSAASANNANGTSSSSATVLKAPRLWHVTKTPVAGFTFATSSPMAYFVERATGYIFTADEMSGDILRRTNTLMPKTYEAYVARDGGAIYRTINNTTGAIQTFSGIVGSSTSQNIGTVIGANLPNNILAMDANPDSKSIFYVAQSDNGSFSGYTTPWTEGKNGKQTQVFNLSIGSWRPFSLTDGRLMILEKPQDDAMGYAYQITSTGSLKPILRGAPGLTFLPLSNSDTYVFGTSENGALTLYAQSNGTTYALPVKTIADKCTWAPYAPATKKKPASDIVVYCAVPSSADSKNFLQNWYMGAMHTSDSWWRMDLTTGKSDQILEAASGGSELDVIDPAVDPTGNFIGFRNNVDGSLWILRINK